MRRSRRDAPVARVFEVSWGWCAAARGKAGIVAFALPTPTDGEAEREILRRCPDAKFSRRPMSPLVKRTQRYFDGWRASFDEFALDLSVGTAFQQRVWTLARRIPYGRVRTYGWIGMEMGRPRAVRAVGNALGVNPLPLLVPCHRVVQADGRLGGFSAEGGVGLKADLLALERVTMHGEGEARRAAAWSDR